MPLSFAHSSSQIYGPDFEIIEPPLLALKKLTPDSELDEPFKVSVGEGGDVALVDAFVRFLRG